MTFSRLDVILVVVGAALSLVDFLIGPKGRQRLRDWASEFWVYLDDRSYRNLLPDVSLHLSRFAERRIGRPFGFRSLLFSAIVAYLLFAVVIAVHISIRESHTPASLFVRVAEVSGWNPIPRVCLVSLYLSLGVTLLVQRFLAKSASIWRFLVCQLIDLVAAYVVWGGSVVALYGLMNIAGVGTVPLMLVVTTMLPVLAHAVAVATAIVLKLTEPVTRKAMMLVLYRFQESDKGSLALISLFFAAACKVIDLLVA